jgi:predicted secreted protein
MSTPEAFSEEANGREVRLSPGQTFRIALDETPTTAFRWQLVSDGTPTCALVADAFEPPADDRPGRPGRHFWTFIVRERGACAVALELQREKSPAEPAKTFRITIASRD